MSLINEQIRKRSNQQPPQLPELKQMTTPPFVEEEQIQQQAAPAIKPEVPTEVDEALISVAEPMETGVFPDAAVGAEEPVADNGIVDLQPEPLDPSLQAQPAARVELPKTPLFRDTTAELGRGGHYSKDVIDTSLPTFYVSNPNTDDYFSGAQRYIESTVARQQREEAAQAAQAQARIVQPGYKPNVPSADKPWNETASQMFNDIMFGSKKAQQETDVGAQYDPLAGKFGRQGAGVGGAFKWALNLIPSAIVGAAGEVTKTTANVLQGVGVPKAQAEAFAKSGPLGLLPGANRNPLVSGNYVGFDYDAANKRGFGGLIGDALLGEPVADINDPRGSSAYGRIFFDPGATNKKRTIGEAFSQRPVQSIIQTATYLLTPDPVGDVLGAAVVSGAARAFRGAKKVARVTEVVPGISKESAARAARQAAGDFEQSEAQRLFAANKPEPAPAMLDPLKAEAFEFVESPALQAARSGKLNEFITSINREAAEAKKRATANAKPGQTPAGLQKILADIDADAAKRTAEAKAEVEANADSIRQTLLVNDPVAAQQRKVAALESEANRLASLYDEGAELAITSATREASRLLTMYALSPKPAVAEAQRLLALMGDDLTPVVREMPAVLPSDVVPALNAARVFPERLPSSIPLHSAVVGIGTPSTAPLVYSGDIIIQSFQDIADDLFATKPELMERFTGKNIGDLQEHVLKQGYDASDLSATSYGQPAVDIPVPAPRAAADLPTDDLITAAEELAAAKQVIAAPKQQLEQLFDEVDDFGRRDVLRPEPTITTADEVLNVFENGGKPYFVEAAFKAIDIENAAMLKSGDFDAFVASVTSKGLSLSDVVETIVKAHNDYISTGYTKGAAPATAFTTKVPDTLYHGTAFGDDWTNAYNLKIDGSRGELGKGLYLTGETTQADMYARASVGNNASPVTEDFDLKPAFITLKPQFDAALNSRQQIDASDVFFDRLVDGLPPVLSKKLLSSLREKATKQTYTSFLDKLEALVKNSGLPTTEERMQDIYEQVTDNLSKMGYDAVYDNKSKTVMAIDGSKLTEQYRSFLSTKTVTPEVARYNTDAYMASFYRKRLSTDANIRDSAYKVHDASEQAIDVKLAEVQREIIKRDQILAQADNGVLPSARPPETKPASVEQMIDDLPTDDVCGV